MNTTTVRTVRIIRSSDGKVTKEVSEHRTNNTSPQNTPPELEHRVTLPTNMSLVNILIKNKRDNHITVPEQGAMGALASRAKLVSRGGVGETESYNSIKNNLLQKKGLYEDADFQANADSIYFTTNKGQSLQWKRPHEICKEPSFFVGGASRFDVCQGELGDCWLLAAVSSLSMQPILFRQVVPSNQGFETENYCGAFHFNFWHYGEWKEVIVDDRLPTRNNRLVFMHSKDLNEFWSALLEKAYAKLFGCYELLKGGSSSEAMEDFTGGVSEIIDIKEEYRKDDTKQQSLFQIMKQAQSKLSMMGCSIEANPREPEAKLHNGLIMGHAYSVTSIKEVNARVPGYQDSIKLVRIRNPWGQTEWKGDWGDSSDKWKHISERDRGLLGLNFENDGEFWMSFSDFVNNYEKLEICHMGPQSLGETLLNKNKRRWEASLHCGKWKKGVSAGGCLNFPDTFWSNPQFKIEVTDPDEKDDDKMGTVLIGLLQKNMRSLQNKGNNLNTIGYVIYKVPESQTGPLNKHFFQINRKVAMSPSFINLREVCGRHKLPPGSYVIIPSTFESNKEAEFLLRIFSEKANKGMEMDETTKMSEINIKVPVVVNDGEMDVLRGAFKAIAGDDAEVDAMELRDILNAAFRKESFFTEFSLETCRSIVAMMDIDLSGRLGFEEFQVMWLDLKMWKTVFKRYDKDVSGSLSSFELRGLIDEIGFKVSNKIFENLVIRFSSKDGMIEFDDLIHCCVRLKTIFMTFKGQKKDSNHCAIFDQDSFIQTCIYS